ncbi:MAG TPA: RNA 2',3'-cyclic phosphodiesterase [Acidobacteriaceae bacterium]
MRLFLGLPVPDQFARSLAHIARATGLKDARWIPPGNIHLTLLFLGSVADDKLPAILHELDHLYPPKLHLRITRLGSFPRAGVLFAEVEPTSALLRLQADVAARMVRCGFPLDDRPYNPHITLARLRAAPRLTDRQLILPPSAPRIFDADCVHLYQSRTLPEGVRYEVLASLKA